MQVRIVTQYVKATDYSGSRIKARGIVNNERHEVSIPYPHEAREGEPAHRLAAEAFAEKFNLISIYNDPEASMKNPRGYVFNAEERWNGYTLEAQLYEMATRGH